MATKSKLQFKSPRQVKVKHIIGIEKLESDEILELISLAEKVKKDPKQYANFLQGKSLVMIFQKTSTRTRLSFEIAMTQLGGHAVFLDWKTSNFQVGDLLDEVRCIGRYADAIMARVYSHADIEKIASVAGVPVINGLSDREHPCQILGDLLTIKEHKGSLKKLKISFIGDGNNVCNSLILACLKLGIKIAVATPKGYEPDKGICKNAGSALEQSNDPKKAAKGADVIYTDTWVSLGQEAETKKRLKVFTTYQVNKMLVPKNAIVMHCLPAHRGHEITDEVIDGPQSVVFDQSENRMHIQKAILLKLLGVA
ncbi:MAG: ornithine carbamoyltransferase [Nanoarchaeota archaeon]